MRTNDTAAPAPEQTRVTVTPRAREELLRLGAGGPTCLRLGVIPGGCAGLTYSAALTDEIAPDDRTVATDGPLRIVAAADQCAALDGLEIAYSDDLIAAGFRFRNPGARRACGCGASFSRTEP